MGWPAVKMHHLELPELPREAAVFFSELSGGQGDSGSKGKGCPSTDNKKTGGVGPEGTEESTCEPVC